GGRVLDNYYITFYDFIKEETIDDLQIQLFLSLNQIKFWSNYLLEKIIPICKVNIPDFIQLYMSLDEKDHGCIYIEHRLEKPVEKFEKDELDRNYFILLAKSFTELLELPQPIE